MKLRRGALCLVQAALILAVVPGGFAQQRTPEVRRAQPANEPPTPKAIPFDPPEPTARPRRTPVEQNDTPKQSDDQTSEAPASETEGADRRQLEYANGLFAQKQYDLAAPEYEKFLGQFAGAPGRSSAYFYLAECYRALKKTAAARTSFQNVLDNYGDSEFAGPAAYGIAEILFNQKDYNGALPLFHKAGAKSKEPALALSARYFEARCLENVDRKDNALNLYQQVAETKNPNRYREDARMAAGTIALARGRKQDALRNYEALANETDKPALKAEALVRAGMVAVDLQQTEKGKTDKAMMEKALALLQKGRSLPEAGKWKAIAQVGLVRLQYQSGQYEKVISEYKRAEKEIPEEVRAEMLLIVGNSHRQLAHTKEADDVYRQIIDKYPSKEEAKDAQYQRLINFYNTNAPTLLEEIDTYIASNPTPERADQAKLLKAEHFYKEQKFADAAPIYAELRASQLSPKLRSEAAYKLGWCYVQLKDGVNIIDAFDYFVKA